MNSVAESDKHSFTPHPATLAAIEKFYALTDDLAAVQGTSRRVLFEFLRTRPSLTVEEIDTMWAVADLLGELCSVRDAAQKH